MTNEEIHNIWLHMSGKAEGLLEAGGNADLPVMFANAILEYNKRTWVGLTDEEIEASKPPLSNDAVVWELAVEWAEEKLKEKNT